MHLLCEVTSAKLHVKSIGFEPFSVGERGLMLCKDGILTGKMLQIKCHGGLEILFKAGTILRKIYN